jgi:hypothetical protein
MTRTRWLRRPFRFLRALWRAWKIAGIRVHRLRHVTPYYGAVP